MWWLTTELRSSVRSVNLWPSLQPLVLELVNVWVKGCEAVQSGSTQFLVGLFVCF